MVGYEVKDTQQCKKEIVVEVGVAQLIAPATETPKGFYYLSNLDQNITNIIKTIYCYKSNEKGNETVVETLKDALAKVLVYYYPMAGRLKIGTNTKLFVDCTAEGAVFVDAEADCNMENIGDLTKLPDPITLGKLVYEVPGVENILEIPPLVVQVTKFKCGGFTMGLAMNHTLFDGLGAIDFMFSWGQTSRGLPLSIPPVVDRSMLNPRDPPIISHAHPEFDDITDISDLTASLYKEELVYQSFHFEQEDLNRVKSKALDDGNIKRCTSFEALTALMWKARTTALQLQPDQMCKLLIIVDARQRLSPPLPKGYFGNGTVMTSAITTSRELVTNPLSWAVGLVQGAIHKLTDEYIRSAIDYNETTLAHPTLGSTLVISTWSRLAFHEIDFGWGQPTAAGPATLPEKEVILFLARGDERRSMDVVLGLPSSAMVKFRELIERFN